MGSICLKLMLCCDGILLEVIWWHCEGIFMPGGRNVDTKKALLALICIKTFFAK